MTTQSLCGSFLSSKRSLVAFTWTITTVLSLVAFIMALVMTVQINSHYRYLESLYATDDDYNNNNNNGEEGDSQQSQDKEDASYALLASASSRSMAFVALYTMILAMGLSFYGSTAIVGFTSLRGDYIAPCFSGDNSSMRVGMFGGAIVIFANLLLLCAVIFGEFRVEDFVDDREKEEMEPYAVERISSVLAVTCMFLSVLYTIFAVLLFLCSGSDEPKQTETEEVHSKPLVTVNPRDPSVVGSTSGFLTMEQST